MECKANKAIAAGKYTNAGCSLHMCHKAHVRLLSLAQHKAMAADAVTQATMLPGNTPYALLHQSGLL